MKKIYRDSFLKTHETAPDLSAGTPIKAQEQVQGYFERQFGVTDKLYHKVLTEALSKGGDFADLFFEHTISNWLILEDGQVNRAYSDVTLGVGIRTVKGDQVGYGYTQGFSEKAMIEAASTAASIADSHPKKISGQFVNPKIKDYYPLEILMTSIPLESKLPLVQSVNEKAFSLSSFIVKVNVSFHDQQKRILVVTSEGIKAEDLQPMNHLSVSVVAEKDSRRERAGWNLGGRNDFSYYSGVVVDELAQEAVNRALVLFDAVQPPAGEIPVVLGPGVTGVLLHEAIGHGMEADFNRKKVSTYCTMMGKKVAEPFVTIIDDGTIPNLTGSINFDDEGTPSQKTVLVNKGILLSYMHDKISARHYKVKSTGNGRRQSYQHYVQPRMRNTYMLAGPYSPEEVIKRVDHGIYVQDVSNGQVKIGEGDFAFYVSQGRIIENGKCTAPIKDVNIMGNGPKMLKNITMVANDFEMAKVGGACGKGGQAVPVSFGQPTCLVESLTVGGIKS